MPGFLAGGTALAVLLSARLLSGRPGFLEAISDGFVRFIPLDLFDLAIATLGPLAKGTLYVGIAVAAPMGGGLLALGIGDGLRRRSPLVEALIASSLALGIAELLVLPLFGAGIAGADLQADAVVFQLPLLLAALVYGLVLAGLRDDVVTEPGSETTATIAGSSTEPRVVARRTVLRRALAFLGLAALGGSALALLENLVRASRPLTGGRPVSGAPLTDPFGPTPALTPVSQFYRIDKNLLPVAVDGSAWRLVVDGLVDRPRAWTLDELRGLPSQASHRTLACISLQVEAGDDLIGNQKWRGVPISALLEEAGVGPAASHVLWQAADGYTESVPLEVVMDEQSWIAYEMGDAPLTPEHGYPARVLIAGRFGMKQPKWVTRLQVADHDEPGYWEQRGWDRDAFVLTMSRVDRPSASDTVRAGVPFTAYGIANSGDRGIATVELSPDDGATWLSADLEDITEPPLGPLTWVRWRVPVTIAEPGSRRLVVRATDATGQVQDGRSRPPLPSGATGWHAVRVSVVA